MIIEALVQYYKDHESLFPPEGGEEQNIDFVIILRKNGSIVSVEDRRNPDGEGQLFIIPKKVDRTSGKLPTLLWDDLEYTLGAYSKASARKGAQVKCQLFKERVRKLSTIFPDHTGLKAINLFYEAYYNSFIETEEYNQLSESPRATLTFQLQGDQTLVAEDERFFAYADDEKTYEGICMITGENDFLTRVFTPTPVGGQGKSKFVNFQVKSGYDSYNREQGYNAPISKKIDCYFSRAFNRLNKKGSPNSLLIGERRYVFWATSKDSNIELSEFDLLFNKLMKEPIPQKVQEVENALLAPKTGIIHTDGEQTFYIMGFSQTKVRLSVNYWRQETVASLCQQILQHIDDLKIVGDKRGEHKFDSVSQLLKSVSRVEGKDVKIQSNLSERLLSSVLEGVPYPVGLAQSCLRRILATLHKKDTKGKEEIGVTRRRAAILKAYINRKNRFNNHTNNQLSMALDINNQNLGYLCGRLFAVVDRIQEKTMESTSIRERYMNSASATPAMVFSRIMNLSNYHLAKSDKIGFVIMMEKLKGEIMSKIPSSGFPSRLSFDDQATFMVGYYHQRQSFFEKTTEESK